MNKRKIASIIFLVIAIAINALIMVESCIGGEGSGSQSQGFTDFIVSILEKITPGAPYLEDKEALHAFIRKLFGHFLLFGLSGIFTSLAILFMNKNETGKAILICGFISTGVGLFFAAASEIIQYFVPGRAGMLTDIVIDFSGYLLFGAITFGIYLIILYNYKIRAKKE